MALLVFLDRSGDAVMKILLLILGSPIWLSLSLAAVVIILSLLVALWSIAISLWISFSAVTLSVAAGIILGCFNIFGGNILIGIAYVFCGLLLVGLAILMYFAALYTTKGMSYLTRKIVCGIKFAVENMF